VFLKFVYDQNPNLVRDNRRVTLRRIIRLNQSFKQIVTEVMSRLEGAYAGERDAEIVSVLTDARVSCCSGVQESSLSRRIDSHKAWRSVDSGIRQSEHDGRERWFYLVRV
jgi:hypothetical protein